MSVIKKLAKRALPASVALDFARLNGDRGGATVIALAVSLSVVAGFAGLGTEAANWYLTKRAMQGAADAAASTAAAALAAGAHSSSILTSEAKSVAAAQKFASGTGGTTVNVNYPPRS